MNIVIKNIPGTEKKNIVGGGGRTHERLVWVQHPNHYAIVYDSK